MRTRPDDTGSTDAGHDEPVERTSPARAAALDAVTSREVADWWTTEVSDIEPGVIRFRGYPVQDLIRRATFVETVWTMVRGSMPSPAQAALLEKALVAAVDHGPQAPSIAAARMAATCGVGLHGAMSTGVGLLGDVHGGAGQQCVELLQRLVAASTGGEDDEGADDAGSCAAVPLREAVAAEIAAHRERRSYIPGFGHRFHSHDPRRDPLLEFVREAVDAGVVGGRHLAAALELEAQLSAGRERPVPMNIDGATAVIYAELGFTAELARGLFILSRSVGVLAHSWEETRSGRRIKGPMPPPLLPTYTGQAERAWTAETVDTP
ncbi:citryl-CoA lyase [Streptomyces viridosporus]|uniref:citrate synthase (unknown stereospecificity) n=1 Tax=Streptomyces viridosporus (strain ATCC 14672 / DSM 40746 / JCM 4963 / KCTC 9882 / NRRL B-12104 / FH 1290) TaxID=566461 RepID=D5ZRQ3_STRV1|nr:citryl-CoA lyase [Streptomyces viridosporus]EFE66566.1 citrate synthase [Streptomyces viridosporus ATCC 14672]